MGLQLIFVVECDKKSESDWIYIKETIRYFYEKIGPQIKLNHVYMEGKGKYKDGKIERKINKYISEYKATNKSNISKVIYCFDCDDYDIDSSEEKFLENAFRYCKERDYDFIWFCKDVERVYIGKKVSKSEKTKTAIMFIRNNLIEKVNENQLNAFSYQNGKSNIFNILNQYLKRKE